MDDFPVGNPKYSRIKATYAQPPVRQAHPITPSVEPPPDLFWHDIAAIAVGILVLVAIWWLSGALAPR